MLKARYAADATRIWTYLTGVEYPASKLDIVAIAVAAGAPQDTVELLQSIHGERFEGPEALQVAIQSRADEIGR